MPNWKATVRVGAYWKNESLTLAERAKGIAGLLNACPRADDYLNDMAEELVDAGLAGDVDWFDTVWNAIYDWADDERVWIDVWGTP